MILTVSLHTVCLAPKSLLRYNDRLFLCDFSITVIQYSESAVGSDRLHACWVDL